MLRSIALKDLNPHIICVLCGGYLVDATTIIECLHSFCRSCIVRYLETSYHCPVCDVEIHKTRPLLNIRADRVLQDIVYKLVPDLCHEEHKGRKELLEKLKREKRSANTNGEEKSYIEKIEEKEKHGPDIADAVCITLEFYRRQRNIFEKQIFPTRYLRCSSAVTVGVLKKFLAIKFGIPTTHKPELVRCDEILDEHLTMRELARIYGLYAKSFLDFQYLFIADNDDEDDGMSNQQVKRLKRTHQQQQQELLLYCHRQQQLRLQYDQHQQQQEQQQQQHSTLGDVVQQQEWNKEQRNNHQQHEGDEQQEWQQQPEQQHQHEQQEEAYNIQHLGQLLQQHQHFKETNTNTEQIEGKTIPEKSLNDLSLNYDTELESRKENELPDFDSVMCTPLRSDNVEDYSPSFVDKFPSSPFRTEIESTAL